MSETDRRHHSRRARSPSDDETRHRRRRDHDYRKRSRSRSAERPRKRRSTSPDRRPSRRSRSRSPRPNHHDRRRSRSREPTHRSRPTANGRHHNPSTSPAPRSRAPLPSQNAAFTGTDPETHYKDKDGNLFPKEKPNWAPSGRLAAAANTIRTANKAIILKYHEPAEARKPPPSQPWRLYVFKDDEIIETVELHTQSCWLFGREEAVVDVLLEHGSCSKQHAVMQFRWREERGEFGERKGRVRLYVLDLESVNGTEVNGEKVEGARYVEVRGGDVVRFGGSEREYVLQLPPREEKKEGGG